MHNKALLKENMRTDFFSLVKLIRERMLVRISKTKDVDTVIALYNILICMQHDAYEILEAYDYGMLNKANRERQEFLEKYAEEVEGNEEAGKNSKKVRQADK